MIVATEISVNEHFESGKRDFIRVNFKNQVFPSSENSAISDHLTGLISNEGNIDFLCLTDTEEPLFTNDGLFLCASGEISINKTTMSAFSYYHFSIKKKIWERMRSDVMGNSGKNMLIYFSQLYGRVIDNSDNNYLSLKVKLGFEKIVWAAAAKRS